MAEPLPWPVIHDLEVAEDYPAAIDALEDRLAADPYDREAVIRLGFNLWNVVVEEPRFRNRLPAERYAQRFMELFRAHAEELSSDADFCWAFGLGMSMFPYYFPGATEELGNQLLDRARSLDPFWATLDEPGKDWSRLKGRGIFAAYYAVT
ncbi:MAG: hypothetical protein WD069_02245 [Planctomycetales bacterium]